MAEDCQQVTCGTALPGIIHFNAGHPYVSIIGPDGLAKIMKPYEYEQEGGLGSNKKWKV